MAQLSQKYASTVADAAPETTKPATTQAPVHLANINSLPEFATVTIDGKKVGTTPLTVQIALGQHTIQVERNPVTPAFVMTLPLTKLVQAISIMT